MSAKTRRTLIRTAAMAGTGALLRPRIGLGQAKTPVIIAVNAGSPARTMRTCLAEPYTAKTGVPVQVFEAPLAAAMLAQNTGHPPFDLARIPFYAVPPLAQRGLLEEFTPDEIPGVHAIPEQYWLRAPSGKLAGVPLFFSLYCIAYNTDLAQPSDFDSWMNLLKPEWKDRISVAQPFFLVVYDLNMYSHLAGGDERNVEPGFKLLGQLTANAQNVYSSMASVESQLGRGDIVAAPFYSSNIVAMRRAGVTNVSYVIPREGSMIIPQVMVMPKGAPNRDAARQLMSAMTEPEYMVNFAQQDGDWPLTPAATLPPPLVKELGGTTADILAHAYNPDWAYIGLHTEERVRRMEKIINVR